MSLSFTQTFVESCKNAYYVIADNIMQILLGILIFFVFLLISKKLEKFVASVIGRLFRNKENVRKGIEEALTGPCKVFFNILGAYIGFRVAGLSGSAFAPVHKLFRISTILIIAWVCANFMPFVTTLIIKNNQKSSKKTNKVAVTFLANILKGFIFAIAAVVVISELGYDINGLIAGIGLGGLTFSLAAQKTATNIFGGFAIITDKPFDVGDWISTPSVEGVIEDITMRSTRIRTIADTVVIVPNSTLIEEPITNWSKMNKRLVDFTIGLTYDTSTETLHNVVDKIKKMLNEHSDVNKEWIAVWFDKFSDSSLDIRIVYFTKTTNYDKSLSIKDDINMKIIEIVENENTSFAFPSMSVYMEK